jgi:hypothetical protein
MGGDNPIKSEKRRTSTDKRANDDKGKDNKKQTPKRQSKSHDYSKLEGGENARISPEDLGELIAEADLDKLEQYGGVKVCSSYLPPTLFVIDYNYQGIAGALNTDLERGLPESDLEEKKKTYLKSIYLLILLQKTH